MPDKIRVATRESALALWQARHVKVCLEAAHPGLEVEICGMTTEGDRNKVTPLKSIGGKGVFVKELEVALLADRVDIAVHSMKDVPADLPEGLGIHAICEREDPRDAFVSNRYATLADMPAGSRVGTSSLRRRLQIQKAHPALTYPDLRGNVDTRLAKLDSGDYDAIILATAGLKRLQLAHRITASIEVSVCLPSAGQGAVGIECRSDREELRGLLAAINHEATALRVHTERTVSAGLGADCTLPIASYAEINGDDISLSAFVSNDDGSLVITAVRTGAVTQAATIAKQVVDELIDKGARDLIGVD
ncbi:MAG: hydroxymethylbilane synthase [Pseudomonadales bacterium]